MKLKYGHYSSWAVWAEPEENKPKSNLEDITIIDHTKVNPEIVLVAYNFSDHVFKNSLGNFHEDRPTGTAFKLRYALKDTALYGGYMTDIIKGLHETDSTKVKQYLKKNPEILKKNIDSFCQELGDLKAKNPLLIALGSDVYDILSKKFQNYNIIKIPHYAARNFNSKEKYREKVLDCISCITEEK